MHDQRIKDLISYARKVEKDMFEVATDKEAYYHLLAEKIYKIQKELQEKKNRRLNEQQTTHGDSGYLSQRSNLPDSFPLQTSTAGLGSTSTTIGSSGVGSFNNNNNCTSIIGGGPSQIVRDIKMETMTQQQQNSNNNSSFISTGINNSSNVMTSKLLLKSEERCAGQFFLQFLKI